MSQCSSLYGYHLWNLDDNKIQELCTAWNVSSRNILGLDVRTRTYLISPLRKAMPIRDIIMISAYFSEWVLLLIYLLTRPPYHVLALLLLADLEFDGLNRLHV